ncbi:MAG: hypothetical protein ACJ8F1_04605, partial [Polyangia bacterium]
GGAAGGGTSGAAGGGTSGAAGRGTGGAAATGGANATGGTHAAGGAGGNPGAGGAGGATQGEVACQNVGGTCKFITGCTATLGHLSDVSCEGAVGYVCCIPLGACGPADDEFMCCRDSATFRPACSGGQLMCLPGTTHC